MHRSRILIADDHNLVAELCKNLLEPEVEVVGVVKEGRALLGAASELKPDVILVDIAMPLLNGLDAAQRVKEMFPAVKIAFLAMNTDVEVAAEGFRRGGSGHLLKTCATSELVTAVRNVLMGREVSIADSPQRRNRFLEKATAEGRRSKEKG